MALIIFESGRLEKQLGVWSMLSVWNHHCIRAVHYTSTAAKMANQLCQVRVAWRAARGRTTPEAKSPDCCGLSPTGLPHLTTNWERRLIARRGRHGGQCGARTTPEAKCPNCCGLGPTGSPHLTVRRANLMLSNWCWKGNNKVVIIQGSRWDLLIDLDTTGA